ncbi:phytanoyl-CoA dioxygenase family protein [Aureibacter tunicatorum]|uniref:Ectoine hydroxylase-related dioxygenase (Phytanoyl-CoA dioxygenase family) n=1 Tax=Aureibacter tunicatorum TaxID=866807 RepID=A0AAE3XQ26_9BACT|nr:phytanoyl-CoA dioxygenase family protein [Aureibacter tunicatorum]MDR6240008.1 ectoine hydroxylase-related dioxygenase (phytanoyl-CoA dioxygenase family) [Aureibacter tunicatorum]
MREYKEQLNENGFSTTDSLYGDHEIQLLKNIIDEWQASNMESDGSSQVFSIRRLIKKIPSLLPVLLNDKLKQLVTELGGEDFFLVKAIYFDKPENFNWFVSYHQDLSITVDRKHDASGYTKWTSKHGQIGVIPPQDILENIFTIRIHLDDTDNSNGALRVIPKSHSKGIRKFTELDALEKDTEVLCPVNEGEAMLMKPLSFHASSKSNMTHRRRVMHLEFSNQDLKVPLNWGEKELLFFR